MKYRSLIILYTFLLTLSTSTIAADLVDISDYPKWFKKDYKRDVKISKRKKSLVIEELGVDAKVFGKPVLASSEEGFWYFTYSIKKSDIPIECYIYTSFDGTANALQNLLDFVINNTASSYELPLTGTRILAIENGFVDTTPYLSSIVQYNLSKDTKSLSGTVKIMSARTGDTLQICIHNDIGFRKAFKKIGESFIGAIASAQQKPAFFRTAFEFVINGQSAGFAEEYMQIDADGDVFYRSLSSMMMAVDESTFAMSDTVLDVYSRPDGSLINLYEYTVDNDVLSSKYDLRARDNKWVLSGELQGKPLNATLGHDSEITSPWGSYVNTKALMANADKQTNFTMWMSDVDPTTVIDVNLEKITDNKNANVKMSMGPLSALMLVEESGISKAGKIEMGPVSIDLNLMFVEGVPDIPK